MHLIIFALFFVSAKCDDYITRRNQILELEANITVGGGTLLSHKESIVNTCLMRHKSNEIDYGFNHPELYGFSRHFFYYKDSIPYSKVYQIIKAMPKGAVLHVHDMAVLGPDYMLNITYKDHLYVCLDRQIQFLFSNHVPSDPCEDSWRLMRNVRRTVTNITEFDRKIRKYFTLVVENPDVVYSSITQTWDIFTKYFNNVYGLLAYKPVWKQYVHDVLKTFKEDNIMYVEMRSSIPNIYELNGTVYDKPTSAKIYKKIINQFTEDNSDFFGMRFILAPSRKRDNASLNTYLQLAREINREIPEFIVGFDLVGQEDTGKPLINFVPLLKTVKDLNFFFHAGETNWYGTTSDENLVDAVLLGAKRIGHAYALTKHPVIMKEVCEKGIGLEVNVLSNNVLSLVRDVRNHPLAVFLSHGLPVVLSSDDPGAWEADPLSDDFYVAFVAVASKHSDLRMLKTLALNSLKYSALSYVNKQRVITDFHLRWNHFINTFNCSSY